MKLVFVYKEVGQCAKRCELDNHMEIKGLLDSNRLSWMILEREIIYVSMDQLEKEFGSRELSELDESERVRLNLVLCNINEYDLVSLSEDEVLYWIDYFGSKMA